MKTLARFFAVLFCVSVALWATESCLALTDSSSFGGTLVTPRSAHTANSLKDGRVLLAGGGDSVGAALKTCELYDPATNSWTATGSMHDARFFHSSVRLRDGRVLAVGGRQSNLGADLATAEIYDSTTGLWSSTGSMNAPRSFFDPVLLADGKVLVAGGYSTSGYIATAEVYDPASGTWSLTGSLKQARYNHRAVRLTDGKVIVTGGYSYFNVSETELYDPVAGTFSDTGSLNVPRSGHVAVLLKNGLVLVTGGERIKNVSKHQVLHTTEIYDPATGLWTQSGPLQTERYSFTANVLPNGDVIAVGGLDQFYTRLSSVEEFNPVSQLWRLASWELNDPREQHTTTKLLDGGLIVAGGDDGSGLAPDAELITGD